MSPSVPRIAASRAWRLARARVRGCAIVLTYHRIGSTADDPHRLTVDPVHFEEQMRVLAAGYTTLTATQLARAMTGAAKLPRRAVVVTFDDGYAETHATAERVMGELGLRATSFLCSASIDSDQEYPWDAGILEAPLTPDAISPAPSAARPNLRVLSSIEARHLQSAGVIEFGAHTRTHPRLSNLDADSQRDEILGGKSELEHILGGKVSTFAYPHGGSEDFDSHSRELASEAGFDAAFTTAPGIVVPWADRFTIPRYHTEDIPGDAFKSLLDRWFDAAR